MATLTRSNSGVNPTYKDYVNFLGGYKNGKKDENEKHFLPLSPSSSAASSSSLSSSTDVPDFTKNTCISYNSFLENTKNKKFSSVKPKVEEKEKSTKKSEIFIEIQQPTKSVSEVAKIFQQNRKSPARSNSINSKISIFEKPVTINNKPKVSEKPVMKLSPPASIQNNNGFTTPPPPSQKTDLKENGFTAPPPHPPVQNSNNCSTMPPPPPSPKTDSKGNGFVAPPPPPMPSPINHVTKNPKTNHQNRPPPAPQPPRLQATLKSGPQTKFSVHNPNGGVPNEIDRNDPLVRKLVYGTLRGLYGAYHDQASGMLATLPKNMVVKSNGVQDRIEQIAANGDLDKLNGRVNPKLEQAE